MKYSSTMGPTANYQSSVSIEKGEMTDICEVTVSTMSQSLSRQLSGVDQEEDADAEIVGFEGRQDIQIGQEEKDKNKIGEKDIEFGRAEEKETESKELKREDATKQLEHEQMQGVPVRKENNSSKQQNESSSKDIPTGMS